MRPEHAGLRRFPTGGNAQKSFTRRSLTWIQERVGLWRTLALVGSVVLATLLILAGPHPSLRGFATEPFRYRVWERPEWEVRARVAFTEEDVDETLRLRNAAAAAVPPVFVVRPDVLGRKLDRVSELLGSLAAADPDVKTTLPEELTEALEAELKRPGSFDKVHAAIQAVRKLLSETGLLSTELVAEHRFPGGRLYVVGGDSKRRLFRLEDVSIERVLEPGGPVHQELNRLLADWNPNARLALLHLLRATLRDGNPIVQYSAALTEKLRETARQGTAPAVVEFEPGSRLVGPGETITPEVLDLLRREHESYRAVVPVSQRLMRAVGVFLLVLGVALSLGLYIVRIEPELWKKPGAIEKLLATMLLGLAVSILAHRWDFAYAPAVAIAMLVAIVYGQPFALVSTLGLDLCIAWAVGFGLADTVVLAGATTAAVLTIGTLRNRLQLALTGLAVAVTLAILTWAAGLAAGSPTTLLIHDSFRRLVAGLVAGALVSVALPLVERLYGVTTHISLLELCDAGHPLLRKLAQRAPGTYNHSVIVAVLAERAAEAIGADALLVRVGAYFHDIGKLRRPEYFIENNEQALVKYQQLDPALSAKIIIGHVKEGVELAHDYRLPKCVVDFIQQHHGTTLVEYFYHEAAREVADDWDHRTDAEESVFRYPGPRPQTREAAILMLADVCESACRALDAPTPAQVQDTVHRLVRSRLLDGQFDECNLTMREIRLIEQALVKTIVSMQHQRVRYPSQGEPEEKEPERMPASATSC